MKQINKLLVLMRFAKLDGIRRVVLFNEVNVISQIHRNVIYFQILKKRTSDNSSIFNKLNWHEVA
ncbi:hypothetical protein M445_01005 [Vibrio owensii 47666-1]|nr:hypothetical protein M445_01005 [Vibrio owensii 47666-1]QLK48601.1 hypothetical protein DR996_26910 [Vibrio owensii]